MSKNILVVGTGTIGEPLIGLLAEHKPALGIDNVYFFKRTPLSEEKGKVEALQRKGAELVTKKDTIAAFKELGFDAGNVENAYEDSQVSLTARRVEILTGMMFTLNSTLQNDLWHRVQSMDLVPFLLGVLIMTP